MSNRAMTVFWGVLALWNGYSAVGSFSAGNVGWGIFGFVLFAYSAWCFAAHLTETDEVE